MDQEIKSICDELNKLSSRVRALEVQVQLMDPTKIIEFKGKVIEALRSVDTDLEKAYTRVSGVEDNVRELDNVKYEIAQLKTKVTIYATIVGAVASAAMTCLIKWLL